MGNDQLYKFVNNKNITINGVSTATLQISYNITSGTTGNIALTANWQIIPDDPKPNPSSSSTTASKPSPSTTPTTPKLPKPHLQKHRLLK